MLALSRSLAIGELGKLGKVGKLGKGVFSARAALCGVLVAFVAGVLLSLAIRPPGAASQPTVEADGVSGVTVRARWRVPLSSPRNLPGSGETPIWFAETLAAATDGAVVVQLYDPGELAPAFAITEAVRDRKVQAGFTWLGYDQGRIPSSALFGATPFGMVPWAYIGWWHFGGGKQLAEGIYEQHRIRPLLCGITGPETAGWFRAPIASAADLQGMKIRFAGLGGKVVDRVGASVTMLPAGEIFQALETGVIDATEFSQPVTDQALGFARVAKYNYFPGWHQPFSATHLVVNLDVWDGLAAADRALIDAACAGATARSLGLTESLQGPVVASFPEVGVTASYLPDDLLVTLKTASLEVLAEEAAKDADFNAVLESQRAFQDTYRQWYRLAYLPKELQ